MIEKPNIKDEELIAALHEHYSIRASEIEFLLIGNDASAFAYRVDTYQSEAYFLKIKKQLSNLAGLYAPRFLMDHGIKQIVAPLYTKTRKLVQEMEDFALILYPFIAGNEAMKIGMTDSQWKEFGSTLKQIHSTELPSEISQYVCREMFVPHWSRTVRELHEQVKTQEYDGPYQRELANFWKENHKTIQIVVERADMIGKHLQQTDLEFVLCHADIHTANILITAEQGMFIVDWDDALLAPKERDLMFVLGSGAVEEKLFFHGYGSVKINQLAIAYYGYEWCVQEIGDFGQRVFLTKDTGEHTKQDAVEGFKRLFASGDVIEAALDMPFEMDIRNYS